MAGSAIQRRATAVIGKAALMGCCLATPTLAKPDTGAMIESQPGRGRPEPSTVRLVSAEKALRPGEINELGLLFTIDEGWHIYWSGVNDSGLAPSASWTLPRGIEIEPIRWPAPHRYIAPGGILDHIYETQALLIVPVFIPEDAAGTTLAFAAEVDWLVCKEACVPGYAQVRLTMPVAEIGVSEGEAVATEHAAAFEAARARLPDPYIESDSAVKVRVTRGVVEIDAPGARTVSYYPQSEAARAEDLLQRGQSGEQRLRLRLAPYDRAALAKDPVIRFVVEAEYPGEESPVLVIVEKPLSELGG